MTTTVLGIVGSVSTPSKTRTAVEAALDGAAAANADVRLLHLGEYDLVTADGRLLEDYEGDTATVLDAVVSADAYVVGTPVYRAAYSGLLKNLFDMVPRGKWQADVAPFEGSPVALVATGATAHHYLAVDTALRPLLAFFGAYVVGGAYLHDDHFAETETGYDVVDGSVDDRLTTLGGATAELSDAVAENDALSELSPQI
jgi:FMN reductase